MTAWPHMYTLTQPLALGQPDEWGRIRWMPRRVDPDAHLLESLYARLPAKFPPLFERLLLTFRWADVSLDMYSLMANPVGQDLNGFFNEISRDRGLWGALIPAGYLRFGKGPQTDYDPVCFDMNSRRKNREMRVVKIDHEEILCNYRVKIVHELAPNFKSLVLQTIAAAKTK